MAADQENPMNRQVTTPSPVKKITGVGIISLTLKFYRFKDHTFRMITKYFFFMLDISKEYPYI
jgi:hypothetical protein